MQPRATMPPWRCLIVNADDFGQSSGVNRGIIEAHEHGIVTSASLMVRWPAAAAAAEWGRAHPELSVGLHLDLGEWAYRDQAWVHVYEVVPDGDEAGLRDELLRQLEWFRRLMGKDPTHIDSHQHVHHSEPLHSIVTGVASELGAPVRGCHPAIGYCGDFYGQTGKGEPLPGSISVENLLRILEALPPGITELGCHPGLGDDVETMYRAERAEEVRVLCDAGMRAALIQKRIELCSFAQVAARLVNLEYPKDRGGDL